MTYQFTLDADQEKKLDAWFVEQNAKGVAKQKSKMNKKTYSGEYDISWEMGVPYTGAIGGEFTFCFEPNTIGMVVYVKNAVTGDEINLTDYDSW